MSQLKLIQHPMGILVVSHYTLCINLKEKPQLVFDGYVQFVHTMYFCIYSTVLLYIKDQTLIFFTKIQQSFPRVPGSSLPM